jgi:tetratricopeptide (TPR) repeat protein
MIVPLKSWVARIVFLLLVVAAAGWLVARTGRVALAGTWGDSGDPEKLRRAIALDPANPHFHYALGNYYLQNPENNTAEQSAAEFRAAVRLNPIVGLYWEGLGRACDLGHDSACAREALHKAMELAPSRPQFVWEAAVYDVVGGERDTAAAELRRFLSMRPQEARAAFELLQRGFGDWSLIEQGLLAGSNEAAPKLAYLDFLAQHEEYERAAVLWASLTGTTESTEGTKGKSTESTESTEGTEGGKDTRGITRIKESGKVLSDGLVPSSVPPVFSSVSSVPSVVRIELVLPYLETLIAGGRYRQAYGVWQYLQKTGQLETAAASELMYNGGFEHEPLKAGFDWRFYQQPYLALDFAASPGHSGGHALRVDFTVPNNADYEPVTEFVAVNPGRTYVLAAYARSEAITSDSGPRLRVTDPACPACLDVSSEGTTGTTGWHQVSVQFTTGTTTEAVRISVYRPRSRVFPMDISGQAWFDDVSLKRIE